MLSGYRRVFINVSYRNRERTVQPKLDRSDSVLFSRVRPAIQYRSSTDRLDGGVQVTCRLLTAAAAATAATMFVNAYSAD